MFRNFVRLSMLALVLAFAAQAQATNATPITLLSYWPMNDGLSNATSTVCVNQGLAGSAYNANFGVAYATGTSLATTPGLALGTSGGTYQTAQPYNAGGYSSTYTAAGGSNYTLPQWTTSGPAKFGYGLTFSGNVTPGSQTNNWGMNFVYVPGGGTGGAGTGGGGISGACGTTSPANNSNFAISMWVNWNPTTQFKPQKVAAGGTGFTNGSGQNAAYGTPIGWNATGGSGFSNVNMGLTSSTPGSGTGFQAAYYATSTSLTTLNTSGMVSGWHNIVLTGSPVNDTYVYVDGQSVGYIQVGDSSVLGIMTALQQPLTLGGEFAYGAALSGGKSPWPNNGSGPTGGDESAYIGPFNGAMSDVGFLGGGNGGGGVNTYEAEAIYNVPTEVYALGDYNLGRVEKLMNLWANATGTATLGSLTWSYASSGLPSSPEAGIYNNGADYYVNFGSGKGVIAHLIPGDANGDGQVDINDLTIVLNNYGQTGVWSTGNFITGDSVVDINDLTIVLGNYGTTISASAGGMAAVPEPAVLALVATALAGLAAYAWRKRK